MDRNSFIGMILIALLFAGWLFWQQSQYEPPAENAKDSTSSTAKQLIPKDTVEKEESSEEFVQKESSKDAVQKYGKTFAPFAGGEYKEIVIENDVMTAIISNKGAAIQKWKLKEFDKWDGSPVQLINSTKGEYHINFLSFEGVRIDSRDLYYEFKGDKSTYKLTGDDEITLEFIIEVEPGKLIKKSYTFFGDKYIFDNEITLNNMDNIIPQRGYNLVWENGLRYQEYDSVGESQEAEAIASLNGNIADLDAGDPDEVEETSETGIIDYTAIKIKYFTVGIIPQPWQEFDGTVDITATKELAPNDGQVEYYNISYRLPYNGGEQTRKFRVYIGPLEYDLLKPYGLDATVNFGWRFGIRQIGEYFILPIFRFIHTYVGSWGITLILFGFIMKIILTPLSLQQMRSARKMQLLTPEMTRIREKYKDDQQKQQREIMNLYSTYGVNPASGCFPLLLQMPILFALFSVLRNSIDLRQSEFIWWIDDLSRPDVLFDFGFSILGISHISGLALLMGVTMFAQQKLTVTDPRQKSMVYFMPVMFTFMFSFFPAGLNLYYFIFNLLSVAQQLYMNKFSGNQPTLEDLKKAPKKEGWFAKKLREAQEMAEQQGRVAPGSSGKQNTGSSNKGRQLNYNNPNYRKKKKK